MKKTVLLLLCVVAICFVGCKKTICSDFSDGEISWTEYNSVSQVHAYFTNKDRADSHMFDTVRVAGYVPDYYDTNYYRDLFNNGNSWIEIGITDEPIHRPHGVHQIIIGADTITMSWLKDYEFGQQIQLTGLCHAEDPMDNSGCTWTVGMTPIEVEINNQNI